MRRELAPVALVPPAVVAPPVMVVPPPVVVAPPAVIAPAPEGPPHVGSGRRIAAWAFVGGGALALVAGGVTWALREARAAEFNEADGGQCFERDGVGVGGPSCEGLRAQTAAFQGASIASFAVGAALGAASAVLFLTAPRGAERASLRCAPSLGGVACAF